MSIGICPGRLLWDKYLDDSHKCLYLKISARMNNEGYCGDSNKVLGALCNCETRTIQRYLKPLIMKGFIEVVYEGSKRKLIPKLSNVTTPQPPIQKTIDMKTLSDKQAMFHEAFPSRLINCEVPDRVDMKLLIKKIKESDFLLTCQNMSLQSCISRYDLIVEGAFATYKGRKQNFAGRKYLRGELNALFDNIDDVEV